MSSNEDWASSSNDALVLSLVTSTPTGVKTIGKSFHPKFTYPIFGDSEEIFGYQELQINLRYNASDMRPNLSVTYSKKFPAVGDTEAADINGILGDFLPQVAFQEKSDFETAIKHVPEDWTPPGELAATFSAPSGTFEVWKGSLGDPVVKQLVKRIQILVPLFIEGGSQIAVDDADAGRWTVFFLYQKRAVAGNPSRSSYIFAGYCTVYRFFHFRMPTPSPSPSEDLTLGGNFDLAELPCRTRISQFIIIPPFQGKGLGPRLYSIIFENYLKHKQTVEITVEDPNEAFDDLRDIADLHFLRRMPEFQALRIDTSVSIPKAGNAPNNIVDKAAWDAVRAKSKIAPRQFARVLEMHLMSQLPEPVRPGITTEEKRASAKATKEQEHELRLWRLLVKKRIYRQNKDALGQLELRERIEKLNETVSSVEFDYARLLIKAEEQQTSLVANGSPNGKRKADGEGEAVASKKPRVEEE